MTRRYLVRTYGCQMNVHDSERIAGLLEADGLVPAEDVGDADVVVLNTCCIRENADNKLYGHLGRLKVHKQDRPDLQIMVAGCLAQKDRDLIRSRAPFVDVVLGTHNVGSAVDLLHRSEGEGPITEILEESEAFPSALPVRRDVAWSAWVTIQIGCDNRCAFCIVPAVRGREISRAFEEIVDEVAALAAAGTVEVTLLGQNVNSYGRDLTRRRPLFADLLRAVGAVDGIRRAIPTEVTTAWLIGIARHKLVDHWRRAERDERRLHAVADDPTAASPSDDPWEAELDALAAQDALEQLDANHRAVLTLRYLDGLPVPEVAAVMDRTVYATEALLTRAKRAFRDTYGPTDGRAP